MSQTLAGHHPLGHHHAVHHHAVATHVGHPHTPFLLSPLHPTRAEVEEWSHARKWHFWVALLSCIAFLMGNMIGQHGFRAFVAAVIGAMDPVALEFDGMSPPVERIVDPHAGRTYAELTYDQVPKEWLIPLPPLSQIPSCTEEDMTGCRILMTRHGGRYDGQGPGGHPGYDIAASVGTPAQAVGNGFAKRVIDRDWGFGKTIVLEHPNAPDPDLEGMKTSLYSVYAHLSEIGVQEGDVVRRGQVIGKTGMTGIATAPHLHFQMELAQRVPFTPFFPFTGEQARVAGYSFFEAVNVGLGRSHLLEYTIDPLAYLERFQRGAAPTVVVERERAVVVRQTPAQLRAQRLTMRKAQRVARLEQRRQLRLAASPSLGNDPVTQLVTLSPDTLEFGHDGRFSPDSWEAITVRLARAAGGDVGAFGGTVRLRVIYGSAELEQETLTAADFHQGEAVVRILPRGEKTIVLSAEGDLTGQSKAMVYEGTRVVSR